MWCFVLQSLFSFWAIVGVIFAHDAVEVAGIGVGIKGNSPGAGEFMDFQCLSLLV